MQQIFFRIYHNIAMTLNNDTPCMDPIFSSGPPVLFRSKHYQQSLQYF